MITLCPKCGKNHETTQKKASAPMWGAGYWDHYCIDCWLAFAPSELERYASRVIALTPAAPSFRSTGRR